MKFKLYNIIEIRVTEIKRKLRLNVSVQRKYAFKCHLSDVFRSVISGRSFLRCCDDCYVSIVFL